MYILYGLMNVQNLQNAKINVLFTFCVEAITPHPTPPPP